MPRFTFDVHDDGPAEWGDESRECDGHGEIERHVRQLLNEARARQEARGTATAVTTVFVHQEDDGIVLSAYARPGQDVQFVWTPVESPATGS